MPCQHYQLSGILVHVFTQMCKMCVCNTIIIIDFCLHFSLGHLRITSVSTKQLLRDNERIEWFDYDDDYIYIGDDDNYF